VVCLIYRPAGQKVTRRIMGRKGLSYAAEKGRITRGTARAGEEDEKCLVRGLSSGLFADVYKQRLKEAKSHPNYYEPGPKWLAEVEAQLESGVCQQLTKIRVDGLVFALDQIAKGAPRPPWRPRRASLATLKFKKNLKELETMQSARPLKPPTRKP
jgi:hypothetical protein